MVFFWRAGNQEKGESQTKWLAPGYVVGIQDGNAWVAVGGRCFLVPSEATYEDLIGQEGPDGEPMDIQEEPLNREVADEVMADDDVLDTEGLSAEHAAMCHQVGWHVDSLGNPVLVSHRAWAYRTPEPRYPSERFPYRSSWVYVQGQWECCEKEVNWMELEDQHQFIPNGPVAGLIAVFQNRTRREHCLDDVPANIKRRRKEPSSAGASAKHEKSNKAQTYAGEGDFLRQHSSQGQASLRGCRTEGMAVLA